MDGFRTFFDASGNLYVRYLYWNDGRWDWNYNWLDNQWYDNNPAALAATLDVFSLVNIGWRVFNFLKSRPFYEKIKV